MTSLNATLGFTFLALGVLAAAIMYQLWGYPFDKEARKSEAPQWKMNIHRGVGFAYALVYVLLMIQMVPRLWEYQVEFPTRTVVHIVLGVTIGFILVLKISILRFWRHFEEWMPYLGTALVLCTLLLLTLSLPFVIKEQKLAEQAFTDDNRARVAELLPMAGIPEEVDLGPLSTRKVLAEGREVLLSKCVFCHDLKTVIARPRMPSDWYRTASRMAAKPTLGGPIADREVHAVTAYLIAITPDLQVSSEELRREDQAAKKTLSALDLVPDVQKEGVAADPAAAKAAFERVCVQCHALNKIHADEPTDEEELAGLLRRMIEKNGLRASPDEINLVRSYLRMTYVDEEDEEPTPQEGDGEPEDGDKEPS